MMWFGVKAVNARPSNVEISLPVTIGQAKFKFLKIIIMQLKNILSICFSIWVVGQAFTQDITVTYATSYVLPMNKISNIPTEGIKKMNAFERPRRYTYHNGKSAYEWLEIENPLIEVDGQSFSATQNILPTFYKDFSNNKMLIIDKKNDSLTAASIDMDDFLSWKIQRENKIILGHLCRKATLIKNGKNVEAWFATDIDIMDGPEIYFGLPGLILETKIGVAVTRAVKIDSTKADINMLEIPNYTKSITYKEYLKKRKKYGRGLK